MSGDMSVSRVQTVSQRGDDVPSNQHWLAFKDRQRKARHRIMHRYRKGPITVVNKNSDFSHLKNFT